MIDVVSEPVVVDPQAKSLMTLETAERPEPVTVIVNEEVAVNPCSSVTVNVTVVEPDCPATGM